jgi:CheY-like chemotaxis protein
MPKILVIDDSSELRSLVVSTLDIFGFGTCEAADGCTGIQMALESRPDLIICDVQMPGMDGFNTLLTLRDQSSTSAIPFIFLTGSSDRHVFRRGMGCGADDFITKPFKPEELAEAVTTRLARCEELKSEYFRRAERIHCNILELTSFEPA